MPRLACVSRILGVAAPTVLAVAITGTAAAGDGGGSGSSSGESSSSDASSDSSSGASSSESSSSESSSSSEGSSGSTSGSSDSGSSSGSSDSGSTSTSDTEATTGNPTTASTTATTTGVDETGSCGICEPDPGSIRFVTPEDEAQVDSPFPVTVVVTPRCTCEGCDCVEMQPMYTQLFLDTLAMGTPCNTLECEWSVSASLGSHGLYASTAFTDDDMIGTSIDVHVQSVSDTTETGIGTDDGPPGTESTGTTASIGEDAPPTCGCTTPIGRTGGTWLLGLVVLGLRRRAPSPR